MKDFKTLKDIHKGKDIWCIAAGSSMDFIDPSFFEGKIVIGQNQVYKKYPCTYVVMKDLNEHPRFSRSVDEIEKLNIPLIYSQYHAGHYAAGKNKTNYKNSYMFSHNDNRGGIEAAIKVIGTDEMAVIRSTITSIMNIAAYMGAKNIMICGVDCGKINDNLYSEGGELYYKDGTEYVGAYHIHPTKGPMEGATHTPSRHARLSYTSKIQEEELEEEKLKAYNRFRKKQLLKDSDKAIYDSYNQATSPSRTNIDRGTPSGGGGTPSGGERGGSSGGGRGGSSGGGGGGY